MKPSRVRYLAGIAATAALAILFLFASLGLPGCASHADRRLDQPRFVDVYGPWDDPETDYKQLHEEQKDEHGDAKAALVNDRAPLIAIVGGTVLTATGKRLEPGTVILKQGHIETVAEGRTTIPEGAQVIDATGKFVTPGLIDAHSHLGVYSMPGVRAHNDGNENSAAVTPQSRAESAYWPQDPAISRVLAGGVTAALILPGSGNMIGGRGFTVMMKNGRTTDDVAFPGAPATLKMACGENPKRVHGAKNGPITRMGVYAGFRAAFRQAVDYNAKLATYARKRKVWLEQRARAAELDAKARAEGKSERIKVEPAPERPAGDPALDTLAAVLRGEVLVQVHCYRAAELREMVAIADEFGFAIRSFHHALEAYKVRDLLVARGIGINTWVDWWGFKMEAFDGIPENAGLFAAAGGRAVMHSDSPILAQRLNQEAGKALYAARRAGLDLSEDQALRWVTANPAWVLGIDAITGTLEAGKRADVVIWDHHPFSVYAKAETVILGGEVAYRRDQGLPLSDFELGNSAAGLPAASSPQGGAQ